MDEFGNAQRNVLEGFEYARQGAERGEARARQNNLARLSGQYASGNGLMLFDYGGSFREGYERARAEKERRGLAGLAAEYSAGGQQPNAKFYEAVAMNGGDPLAFRNDAQAQQERTQREAGRIAGIIAALPAQARPQAYRANYAKLQSLNLGELPAEWSDDLLPVTQQIASVWGGQRGAEVPSEIRALQMLRSDPELARMDLERRRTPPRPTYDAQRGGWAIPPDVDVAGRAGLGVQDNGSAGGGFVRVAEPRQDFEGERLALAREANERAAQAAADAAEARRRSRWGTAPAGQRFNDQGVLVPIPGYVPPKGTNGDEAKGAAGAAGQVIDAIAYAASDTGVPQEAIKAMTPQQVRDLIKGKTVEAGGRSYRRQTRWMTGPVMGRIPGVGMFANADLEAYRSSAAGKQARINNPTGPVTNADFVVGEKSVWGPDKPDEVNADLIYNALTRSAKPAAPPAAPAAAPTGGRATEGQIVENAQGVRLQLRNGQWQRIN